MFSTQELVERYRELKARFLADKHRPQFHLLVSEESHASPADPNGAIFWNGRYHLFNIFQRHDESGERVHCWAHVSSADLLHWRHHPVALDVKPGDPDEGIYSGNAFISLEGKPTLVYHGVGAGNCFAVADDDNLDHWTKFEGNPAQPLPTAPEPRPFQPWDPFVWVEDGEYRMITAATIDKINDYENVTAAPMGLLHGASLDSLEYVGPMIDEGAWSEKDEDFSTPELFKIGETWVLLGISHTRGLRYFTGDYDGSRFHPRVHGRLNPPGGDLFAQESVAAPDGRRLLWCWLPDHRPRPQQIASGWSGAMSIPMELDVNAEGSLLLTPARELAALRGEKVELKDIAFEGEHELPIRGDLLEIEAEIDGEAEQFGLSVRRSPDGAEATNIVYDRKAGTLSIELEHSTTDRGIQYRKYKVIVDPELLPDPEATVKRQEAPFQLAKGEPLRLRVFLDRSVLEVFANGRLAMAQRIYPSREESVGLAVVARSGSAKLTALSAWRIAPTNPF